MPQGSSHQAISQDFNSFSKVALWLLRMQGNGACSGKHADRRGKLRWNHVLNNSAYSFEPFPLSSAFPTFVHSPLFSGPPFLRSAVPVVVVPPCCTSFRAGSCKVSLLAPSLFLSVAEAATEGTLMGSNTSTPCVSLPPLVAKLTADVGRTSRSCLFRSA
jgi:hypothetical protein